MGLARRGDRDVAAEIVTELDSGDCGTLAVEAAEEFLARYKDDARVRDALVRWRAGC